MSAQNNGGPAFPVPGAPSGSGMTLRDWFAGQAMVGLIGIATDMTPKDGGAVTPHHLAVSAYELADAMLAARSAKP